MDRNKYTIGFKLILSLFLFLACSSVVYAPFYYQNLDLEWEEVAVNDVEDWQGVDISEANSDEISEALESGNFPDDRLSELNADQLNGNMEALKGKENLLNQDELNKVRQQATGNAQLTVDAGEQPTNEEQTSDGVNLEQARELTNHETTVTQATNIQAGNDGSLSVEQAQTLEITPTESQPSLGYNVFVTNAENAVYNEQEKSLYIEHADSIVIDQSDIATDVYQFRLAPAQFDVQSAETIRFGCDQGSHVLINNVPPSQFTLGQQITIQPEQTIAFTDCGFNEVEFEPEGQGEIIINKDGQNPEYDITEGTLSCQSDSIQAEQSATITLGGDCVKCATINSPGSYFYTDAIPEKDFTIHIPSQPQPYTLCLKKNTQESFDDYDGQVDFVNKDIELTKKVQFRKNPLQNNKIAELLSAVVYEGSEQSQALLIYQPDFIFLNSIDITKAKNTETNPNNYYAIREEEQRIIEINIETPFQNINEYYNTDSELPDITIKNNVLIQDNGIHRITILPPNHPQITEEILQI